MHAWIQTERLQPTLHRKIRAQRYLCTRLPFPPASTANCALTMYSLLWLLTKIFKGPDGQIFLL